jgi:hypothetical protein
MERSTEPKATSDGARLNRVQMARALREGAGAEDGRGAEQRMASVERNWSMDGGLRRVGASVTLGVLLASTLTGGRITALRADFLQHAVAGGGEGGSIPGSPGPSVGSDGQGHSPIQDTNQEQQKKMFSKLTGVTAAIAVGASVTVAGAQNTAVQWRVEDGGNGHWYELRELPARPTCSLAASMAQAIGARLIALETSSENEFFNSLRCSQSKQHLSAWQDLSIVNGVWVWGSGETFAFHSWSPGQPDGGWTATIDWSGPMGQCDSLTWGDENCDSGNLPSSLFVEWSADCNGDSIVDFGQCLDGTRADLNSNNIPDCCEQGTACDGIDAGLQAHYTLDGNCLDSSGNGRDGSATGIGYVAGPTGLGGNAASFDGSTSFIQVQGIPVPTDNSFSWALWLRVDAIGNTAVIERIESIGNNLLSPSFSIRNDGALGFGSYSFASGGTSIETAPHTITTGAWIHVACTSATSGIRRVYVNGSLIGENMSADYGQPLGTMLIGRDRLDCCDRFNGAIDDLRIYNRPLSATEVAQLYGAAQSCIGDIYVDRAINGADLGALLAYWGPTTSAGASRACDLNGDGVVNGSDLGILLAYWGPCSN